MKRTILFTPVGGTDPISKDNYYDGSMLHICRHYRPDVVYLYMSSEIYAHEQNANDKRYTRTLTKLGDFCNYKFDVEIIDKQNLKEVHEFDFFYKDFRDELLKIRESMTDEDELIINISSGTPAMKSGLLVLATLNEFPCKLIQVSTPLKTMNEHNGERHADYDVDFYWENNEDNSENATNRCTEVKCPSLSEIKYLNLSKQFIKSYDYDAAYETMCMIDNSKYDRCRACIEYARNYSRLEFNKTNNVIAEFNHIVPHLDSSKSKLFAYAICCDLKVKKSEYADFLRALTPLIVELFKRILDHKYGINIDDYITNDKWDYYKMPQSMQNLFAKSYGPDKVKKLGYVLSDNLCLIIEDSSDGTDTDTVNAVRNLRNIEKEVRNTAAHELVGISDDYIKKKTGFDASAIMKMIREAFGYAGFKLTKEEWRLLDCMNEILEEIMT